MSRGSPLLVLVALLAPACSREPPPPPEKSVFEAQVRAVERARGVEKIGLERKDELDRRLEQADGED
ncbi:MAG: hypothetical protein RML12_00155 [Xanthomonadales bacterium]|nr:hypothetical protein [Xanthomonadales bacterium]